MTKPDTPQPTGNTPTKPDLAKEPKGREGTLGGQPPLNVEAGVQKPGHGGVLTGVKSDAG